MPLLALLVACRTQPCVSPASLYTRPRQATKGKESISFYTLPEYEEWKDRTNLRGWNIKYYKVSACGAEGWLDRVMAVRWTAAGCCAAAATHACML